MPCVDLLLHPVMLFRTVPGRIASKVYTTVHTESEQAGLSVLLLVFSHPSDVTPHSCQHSRHPPGSESSMQVVASATHGEEVFVGRVVVPSPSSTSGRPSGDAVGLDVGDEEDNALSSSPITCFIRGCLIWFDWLTDVRTYVHTPVRETIQFAIITVIANSPIPMRGIGVALIHSGVEAFHLTPHAFALFRKPAARLKREKRVKRERKWAI